MVLQTLIDVKNPLLCREIQSGQKSAGYAWNGVRRASDRKSDMQTRRKPFYHFSPCRLPTRKFQFPSAGALGYEREICAFARSQLLIWLSELSAHYGGTIYVRIVLFYCSKQNTRSRLLPTYLSL